MRQKSNSTPASSAPSKDRSAISPWAACAWTAKADKRVQFGYGLNYLIDIENAVITDVEPTPARTYDEVNRQRQCSIVPSAQTCRDAICPFEDSSRL